jgi:hypothetical protein
VLFGFYTLVALSGSRNRWMLRSIMSTSVTPTTQAPDRVQSAGVEIVPTVAVVESQISVGAHIGVQLLGARKQSRGLIRARVAGVLARMASFAGAREIGAQR